MSVQKVLLNSANVRYNNANDEERVYDIEANANIHGNKVNGFEGGVVKKDGNVIATFTIWGNNFNPSFKQIAVKEMCSVLVAIDEFVVSVMEEVASKEIEL